MEHYLLKIDGTNRETHNEVSTGYTYDKYISMYIERMNTYGFEASMETSPLLNYGFVREKGDSSCY